MSAALRGIVFAFRSPSAVVSIWSPYTSTLITRKVVSAVAHARISTSTGRRQSDPLQPRDRIPAMDWTTNSPIAADSDIPSIPPSYHSKLSPRLGSTAGRSVAVRGGDVAGAFMQLKRICFENAIARDASAQRFYERPGVKKKRLKRERYRRRFKESFKRMVSTVLEMKRQGI